jgi:hypothetical protein
VDLRGATYVTGQTRSGDFPTTASLQPVCSSGSSSDAFVLKITGDIPADPPAGASIAGPPTSESTTTTRIERKGGGGAMDALFLAVLAQLAVAGALRRAAHKQDIQSHTFSPAWPARIARAIGIRRCAA